MPKFDDDVPDYPPAELRRIARYHRWVIAVVITQCGLWGIIALLSALRGGHFASFQFPIVLTFILGAVGGIFTFLLNWSLRRPITGIVMGLACVPPCLGLLVMATVSGSAATILKQQGVKVSWLGANLDSIEEDVPLYDADEEDAGW
jgi:hypothetical protein